MPFVRKSACSSFGIVVTEFIAITVISHVSFISSLYEHVSVHVPSARPLTSIPPVGFIETLTTFLSETDQRTFAASVEFDSTVALTTAPLPIVSRRDFLERWIAVTTFSGGVVSFSSVSFGSSTISPPGVYPSFGEVSSPSVEVSLFMRLSSASEILSDTSLSSTVGSPVGPRTTKLPSPSV